MEQDVDTSYRILCCTCLSGDRALYSINNMTQVYQIFRLLMYDFAGDRFSESLSEMEQLVCWECLALLKRFVKFKWQVHSAQEHLRVIALSHTQETLDHTYMSQSLSSLDRTVKTEYDKIYFDFSNGPDEQQFIAISSVHSHNVKDERFDVVQAVRDNINLGLEDHILEVPELVLENPVTGVMSQIVVSSESHTTATNAKSEMPHLTIGPLTTAKMDNVCKTKTKADKDESKTTFITEYMTENEMLESREDAKQKVSYASAVYKCELCVIGFYTQQQVEDHFNLAHRPRADHVACKVCYVYVAEDKVPQHVSSHYWRYVCKLCGRTEYSMAMAQCHAVTHSSRPMSSAVIKIGDIGPAANKAKKKKGKDIEKPPPKPGDLRKLLSKTTIEGYQCLECDMFFKNSRARKNHVARYHREGLQCDHCKKRFVNRTTLATHLRLHEGPLPREECPICHKMVRVIQLKYHIQRHQNKSRYECVECNKIFSHVATYQAHLKYARAHASDNVFKFPCPMCNKGYPTKEAMQDHFNYQHLGKTAHKCPICEKPIASRTNVERHMLRVHGEKKEKPRTHVCQMCGKGFTDKKALTQHEVIHSGERPLSCDICHQTFKQKASLYTHRKRVHKVFPNKKVVEYMDAKPEAK